MVDVSSQLMILAAGIGVAVFLLMLGAVSGYWAGCRTVAQTYLAAAPDAAWHDERAQLLAELARCSEQSERAFEQTENLAALGRTYVDPLPAELTNAIDRLVKTTSGLAAQLRDVQAPKAGLQEGKPKQPAKRAKPALRIADVGTTSATSLTTEQMSDLIGGRKNLGESTLDLESRRYPYDGWQHVAPWNDGEPAPTLEQFTKVRCHEISVSGISFFCANPPDSESVVISIGKGDKLIFMHAEISEHKAVYMHGDVSFLVGCRYRRRMEELTAVWHAAGQLVETA